MLRELEVVHTNTQLRAPEKEECIRECYVLENAMDGNVFFYGRSQNTAGQFTMVSLKMPLQLLL